MVSLCAGCNVLHSAAAFAVGILGGFTMWWTSNLIRRLRIDDPLDAFAVHYGGGVVGVLTTPFFMKGGIIYWTPCADQVLEITEQNPNPECSYAPFQQWVWNLIGLVAITLWSGSICAAMFALLKYFNKLRVDKDIELRGLDIKKHGEPAYPTVAYGHGWDAEGDFRMSNLNTNAINEALQNEAHVSNESKRTKINQIHDSTEIEKYSEDL